MIFELIAMELNTQLMFKGDCEAAFKTYEQCLGGKIEFMMKFGESPMAAQTPAEWHQKVMHARVTVCGEDITGSDATPEQYVKPQGFAMQLNLGDASEADRIFGVLADHGTVQMPLQETFWALRFGVLVDRFGVPWAINCEKAA
jgi:PhnB protein